MALIKSIEKLISLIPEKKSWIKNGNNTYANFESHCDSTNYLYAFVFSAETKEMKKAYRVDFVVYKGMQIAYLIFLEYMGAITSKTPSVHKDMKSIILSENNEWGFETDDIGVFIKTNNPNDNHIIYFGEKGSDMPSFKLGKAKETVVTETVYV